MRDPTRGGVATSLNELARDCGLGIVLAEEMIPVHDAVRGACELLGLDPLHIANEGQFLAVVAAEYADAALAATKERDRAGEEARMIGEVCETAVWRGSGHDALRWKPNRRHAGVNVVSEFVSENDIDFFGRELLEQCVAHQDAACAAETGERCVGFLRAGAEAEAVDALIVRPVPRRASSWFRTLRTGFSMGSTL